jgi:hypothetical protein
LDESVPGAAKELQGRFVNLFDPALKVQRSITIAPGTRYFLLDLDQAAKRDKPLLASACKMIPTGDHQYATESISDTQAIALFKADHAPKTITLGANKIDAFDYSSDEKLLWVRFENQAETRELKIEF